MLSELKNIRKVEGEPRRRWFSDEYFDLIVWTDESNAITSFQLCYDKEERPRALTWQANGYLHHGISDGEDHLGKPKSTPILVPDGDFDKGPIIDAFVTAAASIDGQVSAFVIEKMNNK
jgi:hypothetical protein